MRMKRNWWKITRLEVRLALADRQSLIWGLLAPLLFTAFIGYTLNAEHGPPRIRVTIDPGDNPEYVRYTFKSVLEADGIEVENTGNVPVLSIPDSLPSSLLMGDGADVEIRVEEESRASRAIAASSRKALYFLLFNARKEWLAAPPQPQRIDSLFAHTGPLHLTEGTLGPIPREVSGTERTLPANIVMFLLFTLFTFFAQQWAEDTKSGKIRRVSLSPTPTSDILLSQISSRMLWGIVQVTVVGTIGTFLFGINWEFPALPAALLLLAYMFCVSSLGMLFGSLVASSEKAAPIGVMVTLVLAAIGGCWWPLEIVPAPMKTAALLTPTGLAMDGFGSFLVLGTSAPFPTGNIAGLVVMGAIALPVATRRMKKQIVG